MVDSPGSTSIVAALLASVAVSLISAGSAPTQTGGSADADTGGSPALQLSVSAVRNVTEKADSIEIEYLVRNLGGPITFANLPEAYDIDVLDPRGSPLRPRQIADYEPPVLGTLVDVRVPRGGLIGQRVRLTCISNGYYEHLPSRDWCGWGFEFTTRGEYKIVVRYAEPKEGGLVLMSDTARIVYRPGR